MEKPLLDDEREYPSDAVLTKNLGRAKGAWDAMVEGLNQVLDGASLDWRFYKDGGAWLCKLTRKKKTLCWLSVWDKSFKVTFYFTEKNKPAIAKLALAAEVKTAYLEQSPRQKLQPLTVKVSNKRALDDIFTLLRYKSSLK